MPDPNIPSFAEALAQESSRSPKKSAATARRLIEVAFPAREVSAESVRDKSLRHGHLSTLHLWWARRPLAAARAVTFASLVPDPDDDNCPHDFRAAVERLLKTNVPPELRYYRRKREVIRDPDPYKPYEGVPDTLRSRLLCFVAKWSVEAVEFDAGRREKEPKPDQLLDDRSLAKWETGDPTNDQGREILRVARELAHIANGGKTPVVLDPFSGGGAIPLEAGRLGCQPIANDYNPLAHLIERATAEFPQKFGKAGMRRVTVEEFGQSVTRDRQVDNVLAHDVEHWSMQVLEHARKRIGHLYPRGSDGLPVVCYIWARTAPCSNPTCKAVFPLLRSLLVCDKPEKRVALELRVDRIAQSIDIGVLSGNAIKNTAGTMVEKGRGSTRCPFCEQTIPTKDLKRASLDGRFGARMVVVVVDGPHGKQYRPPEQSDLDAWKCAQSEALLVVPPSEPMPVEYTQAFPSCTWGFRTWGQLFNERQLVAMTAFVAGMREVLADIRAREERPEYVEALAVYLGLFVSRVSSRASSFGVWHTKGEKVEHPFGRQAIPLTWDYPEANPLSDSTGGASGQLEWMIRYIVRESSPVLPALVTRGDAGHLNRAAGSVDLVVTDPPYFDAISYADVSDYFYVWIKRCLADEFPELLATPLTPKFDEATALKHRHAGDAGEADRHFVRKLSEALGEAHRVLAPGGIVSLMFAHQSTKAWTALVNAIFDAGMTIDATWAIDTELTTALKSVKSALASSVTVVCRPRSVGSAAAFKDVRREIEIAVRDSVNRFWAYGFRGADLIVACYGPAVGVFGKYERVEKASGDLVGVPELLDLARVSARDAIAGEFKADNVSTLYYVWATMYGPGEQAWDDARLVVQIGGEAENPLDVAAKNGIFVVDGSTCRLALLSDRASQSLGLDQHPPLIDALQHSMMLWKEERRSELVSYLAARELLEDGPIWKLAQALFEVLPRDLEDWKLVSALLTERQTLRTEGKKAAAQREIGLFDRPL